MRKLNKSEQRTQHLNNLSNLLGLSTDETKIRFKQLKEIESKGHGLAVDYCNGEIDSYHWDKQMDIIKERLKGLIPNEILFKNIHLNGDPRGYFLKIDYGHMKNRNINLERDWGGYGILCPEDI